MSREALVLLGRSLRSSWLCDLGELPSRDWELTLSPHWERGREGENDAVNPWPLAAPPWSVSGGVVASGVLRGVVRHETNVHPLLAPVSCELARRLQRCR